MKKANRKAVAEISLVVWKTRKFDELLLWYCNSVYTKNKIDWWTKDWILPFPNKDDLWIAKNNRGITLTSIAAKIYNSLLLNCLKAEIKKILWKNQNGFRRNRSTASHILKIRRITEWERAKKKKKEKKKKTLCNNNYL